MIVLAVDPGTVQSGVVRFDGTRVLFADVIANADVLKIIRDDNSDVLAIEQFVATGQPLAFESIQTVHWGGRFHEAWPQPDDVMLIPRLAVKKAVGLLGRDGDPEVNRRLRELVGDKGTKAAPGPTHGVSSHAWAALGVAYAAMAQLRG